jgi:hypothetical protein
MRRWEKWFGLGLGALLIAAGIGETIRLTRSGDGGFWFWFPTLVGGGLLVVTGTLLRSRRPVPGLVLTAIGCVVGIPPTLWTVIVPMLLLTLIVVSAKHTAEVTGR